MAFKRGINSVGINWIDRDIYSSLVLFIFDRGENSSLCFFIKFDS